MLLPFEGSSVHMHPNNTSVWSHPNPSEIMKASISSPVGPPVPPRPQIFLGVNDPTLPPIRPSACNVAKKGVCALGMHIWETRCEQILLSKGLNKKKKREIVMRC